VIDVFVEILPLEGLEAKQATLQKAGPSDFLYNFMKISYNFAITKEGNLSFFETAFIIQNRFFNNTKIYPSNCLLVLFLV
jgi:hypothetical protein